MRKIFSLAFATLAVSQLSAGCKSRDGQYRSLGGGGAASDESYMTGTEAMALFGAPTSPTGPGGVGLPGTPTATACESPYRGPAKVSAKGDHVFNPGTGNYTLRFPLTSDVSYVYNTRYPFWLSTDTTENRAGAYVLSIDDTLILNGAQDLVTLQAHDGAVINYTRVQGSASPVIYERRLYDGAGVSRIELTGTAGSVNPTSVTVHVPGTGRLEYVKIAWPVVRFVHPSKAGSPYQTCQMPGPANGAQVCVIDSTPRYLLTKIYNVHGTLVKHIDRNLSTYAINIKNSEGIVTTSLTTHSGVMVTSYKGIDTYDQPMAVAWLPDYPLIRNIERFGAAGNTYTLLTYRDQELYLSTVSNMELPEAVLQFSYFPSALQGDITQSPDIGLVEQIQIGSRKIVKQYQTLSTPLADSGAVRVVIDKHFVKSGTTPFAQTATELRSDCAIVAYTSGSGDRKIASLTTGDPLLVTQLKSLYKKESGTNVLHTRTFQRNTDKDVTQITDAIGGSSRVAVQFVRAAQSGFILEEKPFGALGNRTVYTYDSTTRYAHPFPKRVIAKGIDGQTTLTWTQINRNSALRVTSISKDGVTTPVLSNSYVLFPSGAVRKATSSMPQVSLSSYAEVNTLGQIVEATNIYKPEQPFQWSYDEKYRMDSGFDPSYGLFSLDYDSTARPWLMTGGEFTTLSRRFTQDVTHTTSSQYNGTLMKYMADYHFNISGDPNNKTSVVIENALEGGAQQSHSGLNVDGLQVTKDQVDILP